MIIKETLCVVEMHVLNRNIQLLACDKVFKRYSRNTLLSFMQTNAAKKVCDLERYLMKYKFNANLSKEIAELLIHKKNNENFNRHVLNGLSNDAYTNVRLFADLIYLLNISGEFSKAADMQKYIIENTTEGNYPLIWQLWQGVLNDDMDIVDKVSAKLLRKGLMEKNKRKIEHFRNLLLNKNNYYNSKYQNEEDKVFSELVNDKCVSIIGPASTSVEWDEILRKSDTIIYITYKGNSVYIKPMENSNIKYISYYNNEAIRQLKQNEIEALSDMDYICTKQTTNLKNMKKNQRTFLSMDGLYYNGIPHMLPNIIFDLLQFNPKSINTYGFNLYLDQEQYRDSYREIKKTNSQWLNDFALHNIAMQYIVLELFFNKKIFKPDSHLENILNMGLNNYLERMECIYSI